MRAAISIALLLVGCDGDVSKTNVDADTTMMGDAALKPTDADIDAPLVCSNGDNICLVGCVTMSDTDCATTCGDGRCVGNANEMCNSCEADCKTTSAVCGNGACDTGEAAAGCYADCGPANWQWAAEEMQLINLINNARTGGKKCPGPGGTMTAPALAIEANMLPHAREWAWEMAHQNYWNPDGGSCNGRTYQQRMLLGNFTEWIIAYGFVDVQATFDDWMSTQSLCQLVMDANLTKVNVAVAFDLQEGYVLVMR